MHLPKEASDQLTSRGQIMAKGTINGAEFYTAMEPDGNWGHWLNLDETLRRAANAQAGETVSVTFEQTKAWPEPTIPADWAKALKADKQVKVLWEDTTPMARWEWLRWINSTNNPATRQKRIEVSCSKLINGWRRPCCFNRNMCCVPEVSKSGILLGPTGVPVNAPTATPVA